MTKYQQIKQRAKDKGIDTRKDANGGYWLTDSNGKDLYPDDNFCSSLAQLKEAIHQH